MRTRKKLAYVAASMKISLVYPVWKDESKVRPALIDINSFFSKFGVFVEVILVFDPPYSVEIKKELDEIAVNKGHFSNLVLKPIWNKKTLYRGGSIARGLDTATNNLIAVASIDLSTPLSEFFVLLQPLLESQNSALVVVGKRALEGRKKHLQKPKRVLHKIIERMVAKELQRSWPELGASVPSTFAVNKLASSALLEDLKNTKWFYLNGLLRSAHKNEIPVKNVEVLTMDQELSHFSIFRFV